jgi:uncharacterized protein
MSARSHSFSSATVEVRPSPINGLGLFAAAPLPGRRKLGELSGTLVSVPAARKAIAQLEKIYYIEVSRRYALDCADGNGFKHLNHSCAPNCYLRIFRRRVEVYTLREIDAGAELTIDYGLTPHKGGMKCQCGANDCRRSL